LISFMTVIYVTLQNNRFFVSRITFKIANF
jgi:hypothetical protein